VNNSTSKELHDLFKEDWEWVLKDSPEWGTYIGDDRYNDRLSDLSFEAIDRRKAHSREMLGRIQRIDRPKLAGQDVTSYDLFLLNARLAVEGERFSTEFMPVSQMEGPQLSFPMLVDATPFRNTKDYEKYLSRLAAFPHFLDQVTALMRRGMETGWIPPAVPLRSIPEQISGQTADVSQSPLHRAFDKFPPDIAETERTRLKTRGEQIIRDQILPGLKKFGAFITDVYLPKTRKDIAASSLPGGLDYYRYAVRYQTTTDLSPQQIHEIGLSEVARIHSEMDAVMKQVGFQGSFQDFLKSLRNDPRFYYTKAEDLVAGYRAIAKRIDGELPRFFAELPRNSYGVREIPEYEAPAQTTAYYIPGATDGSRAGMFSVNTYKLETRPKYEMEALTLHESVPGHHLQISRAQELKDLPDFRRNGGYTAYVEGWALYAESLGSEMGFYSDPYSKLGQLTYEMWRACRLVVDTGMHAMGWSRERAIDFMLQNTAKTENDVIVEIDRYIVWPGQALSYKLGELKIKELRARAKQQLGEKFDLRRFHNTVLDNGALPLSILDSQIDTWISEEKRK
jgi:uncharacterized protein (DUF885 family)